MASCCVVHEVRTAACAFEIVLFALIPALVSNRYPPLPDQSSNSPSPTLADPTLPDPTLPYPTLPDPSLPYPTQPNPSRSDPTRPDPTRPDPTRPNPTQPPRFVCAGYVFVPTDQRSRQPCCRRAKAPRLGHETGGTGASASTTSRKRSRVSDAHFPRH